MYMCRRIMLEGVSKVYISMINRETQELLFRNLSVASVKIAHGFLLSTYTLREFSV